MSTLPYAPSTSDAPFDINNFINFNLKQDPLNQSNQKPDKDYMKWIATSEYSIDVTQRLRAVIEFERFKRDYNLSTEEAMKCIKEDMKVLCTVENYSFKNNALIKNKTNTNISDDITPNNTQSSSDINQNLDDIKLQIFKDSKELINYIKNNNHCYLYDNNNILYNKIAFIYKEYRTMDIDNNVYIFSQPVKFFNNIRLLNDIENNRFYAPNYLFDDVLNKIFNNQITKEKILYILKIFENKNELLEGENITVTICNIPITVGMNFLTYRLYNYNWMYLYSFNNNLRFMITTKGIRRINDLLRSDINEMKKYNATLIDPEFTIPDDKIGIIDNLNVMFKYKL